MVALGFMAAVRPPRAASEESEHPFHSGSRGPQLFPLPLRAVRSAAPRGLEGAGFTETLVDFKTRNERSKFWGDDQRAALKNWKETGDIRRPLESVRGLARSSSRGSCCAVLKAMRENHLDLVVAARRAVGAIQRLVRRFRLMATRAVSAKSRKARFTDSLSGNTSVRSGSMSTRLGAAVKRRWYFPRTPPLRNATSYCFRRSSLIVFADYFFIHVASV